MVVTRFRRAARPALALSSPPLDHGVVQRAVDEGVLIMRLALTMATKNHIIVEALREDRSFDEEAVGGFVRRELRALALEQVGYANRMRIEMRSLTRPPRRSASKLEDARTQFSMLTQRRVTYSALSSELDRLTRDERFVADAVEAARAAAWDDLAGALTSHLDRVAAVLLDPNYAAERGERMRAVRYIDLPRLAR
ncbi:hypothetical protein [Subtercola sp. RTI3]|uniref:hypothetical protein n=1 Tax=Subtercola sp. RTI3 TaxID=3048639 RepID=UPI002B22AF20|nr:hypothetical protein [Subtercola sp. RTI3]MEA9984382.1 hypothetical protein [Subtercola sp. RTI3]